MENTNVSLENIDANLDSIILEGLYGIYGIEDNNTSMNLLYHYLLIRAGIFYQNKKVSDRNLIEFIFQELNIDIFNHNIIIYEDMEYNVNLVGQAFLETLEFRANFEGKINLKEVEDIVYEEGYKLAVKFKKSRYYKKYIQYYRLLKLNEHYNIKPEANYNDSFKKSLSHNPYKRTLEEEFLSVFDSEKINSTTTQFIDEGILEDYLINNLSLIEEGLVYQGRQVNIPGGIIDILAKDKNDNLVIIELKVDNDKSIIWQTLHYPKTVSKVYKVNQANIRMLTLAPNYKKSILERLKDIGYVEIYSYQIKVSLGKITKLDIVLA